MLRISVFYFGHHRGNKWTKKKFKYFLIHFGSQNHFKKFFRWRVCTACFLLPFECPLFVQNKEIPIENELRLILCEIFINLRIKNVKKRGVFRIDLYNRNIKVVFENIASRPTFDVLAPYTVLEAFVCLCFTESRVLNGRPRYWRRPRDINFEKNFPARYFICSVRVHL